MAGYCWNWPKETRNDVNYHDIKIENYGISWNLDGGDAFAINPDSVHEAGCIHTSQGLEFDYVGVIIGDDLKYRDLLLFLSCGRWQTCGGWKTNKRALMFCICMMK